MKEKIDIYRYIYKYKNTEYIIQLFELFKKDMKLKKNYKIDTLIDFFVEWIRYNNDIAKEYVRQLDEEFIILPNNIIEVGSGPLDTLSDKLDERGYNTTVISQTANMFMDSTRKINGTLDYSTNEGLILTQKEIMQLNRVKSKTLISTLPTSEKDIQTLLGITNEGYNLLIGTYNDTSGTVSKENIERLRKIREHIKTQGNAIVKEYDNTLGSQRYSALHIKRR